jgi:type III pantothenate kinase
VIDAGTALTFTGLDAENRFAGGAILPGLRTQLRSLHQSTAELPAIELPEQLPPKWAFNTPDSICSGVLYSVLAAVQDFGEEWLQLCGGKGAIVFTGGDGKWLLTQSQTRFSSFTVNVTFDPNLIFWGIQAVNPI